MFWLEFLSESFNSGLLPVNVTAVYCSASSIGLSDIVSMLVAVGTFLVLIWGTFQILNELKLRAIDSIAGYYAQLSAYLICLQNILGVPKTDTSLLRNVYSHSSDRDVDDISRADMQQFQEQIDGIILLLKQSSGQLPLSESLMNNRKELLSRLLEARPWNHTRFNRSEHNKHFAQADVAHDRIDELITSIHTEIDGLTPVLVNSFWRKLKKKTMWYKCCKHKGRT